jgi:hypothetical protein
MRSKELPIGAIDRIVSRQMEEGQTKQSGEKGFGQGGDQEHDGPSDRAPEFLCGDGRTFQKDNHLQYLRKVFRPLDFFHILLVYSLILKWIKSCFSLINLHTIPHNDKAKTFFRNVC